MFACRLMRGHLAAAVYDDLDVQGRAELGAHLAHCASCQAALTAMKETAGIIPRNEFLLGTDLAPALLRQIETPPSHPATRSPWIWATATLVAVTAGLAIFAAVHNRMPSVGSPIVAAGSAFENAFLRATALANKSDYTGAYRELREAVAAEPENPRAGEAQIFLADLTFSKLRWYPAAYDEYQRLVMDHPTALSSSPERYVIAYRRNLLAEARKNSYAGLEALDAAMRSASDPFHKLEQVIAVHPGTYVASLAAEEMARLMVSERQDLGQPIVAPSLRLYAMETARRRCTDPVAVSQLDIEVGHICRDELGDLDKARTLYQEVAASGPTVLALAAQEALSALERK